MSIASGTDKWESEDQAQYEHFNPGIKPVREVLRKQANAASVLEEEQSRSLPLQKTGLAVTVGNAGHDLDKTTSVNSVMLKKLHYCLENQSVNEARRIIREHEAQYLLVLDNNLRVVGVVTMRDLAAWYESL
jgi:CBS domain-containing protein